MGKIIMGLGIILIIAGSGGGYIFGTIPCLPLGIAILILGFIVGWFVSPQRQEALLMKAMKEREEKDNEYGMSKDDH